ncbi:MAG: DNA gyrase subunit A [Woeseiaceae bacterium]|nr:DNA gyrase subunit A [Woeseiaceae bacterium]
MPGPDFPTAGIINGRARASVRPTGPVAAEFTSAPRSHIETDRQAGARRSSSPRLPYQVNKARLIEKIAELVRDKRIEGISELRDESDKDGMRVVIELRRGEVTDVVLNNLYKQTPLQTVFGINMVALHEGQPEAPEPQSRYWRHFLAHRREVVTRRTVYLTAARRGTGPTCSRARPWHWPISTK